MGCRLTKAEKEEEPKDFDKLEEKTSVPQVDSRLPIDAREAFKLKQSWKGIKRRIEETGVEMFIRYDLIVLLSFQRVKKVRYQFDDGKAFVYASIKLLFHEITSPRSNRKCISVSICRLLIKRWNWQDFEIDGNLKHMFSAERKLEWTCCSRARYLHDGIKTLQVPLILCN